MTRVLMRRKSAVRDRRTQKEDGVKIQRGWHLQGEYHLGPTGLLCHLKLALPY